jgi:hypothetical protein
MGPRGSASSDLLEEATSPSFIGSNGKHNGDALLYKLTSTEGFVTEIGIERRRRAGYLEFCSFRIAATAFRPRSFNTPSGCIPASP